MAEDAFNVLVFVRCGKFIHCRPESDESTTNTRQSTQSHAETLNSDILYYLGSRINIRECIATHKCKKKESEMPVAAPAPPVSAPSRKDACFHARTKRQRRATRRGEREGERRWCRPTNRRRMPSSTSANVAPGNKHHLIRINSVSGRWRACNAAAHTAKVHTRTPTRASQERGRQARRQRKSAALHRRPLRGAPLSEREGHLLMPRPRFV